MAATTRPVQHPGDRALAPVSSAADGLGLATLWERYRSSGDAALRDEILHRHVSLVHFVARGMAAKARAVAYDDLVSAGSLGLLAAFEGYDPALGFAFST